MPRLFLSHVDHERARLLVAHTQRAEAEIAYHTSMRDMAKVALTSLVGLYTKDDVSLNIATGELINGGPGIGTTTPGDS